MNNLKQVTGVPFVAHVNQENRPTLNDVDAFIKSVYNGGYHGNYIDVSKTGILRRLGYQYNLRDYLKKYIVKDYYGNIFEMYAPNKMAVRKCEGNNVRYIIEIKK